MIDKVIAYFKEAYQSLSANKSRTLLSMLGIIMGVFSVVLLQTIGEGVENLIKDQLSSIGSNNITIRAAKLSNDIRIDNIVQSENLINDDMINLLKKINTILYISPLQSSKATINYANKSLSTTLEGINNDYSNANTLTLYAGSMLFSGDYDEVNYKGIIGFELAKDLFEQENPLGKKVNIDNNYITIVGITSSEAGGPVSNPDNKIFVSLNTMKNAFTFSDIYQSLTVVVDKEENIISTKQKINELLNNAYILKGGANIFDVSSNTDFLESTQQIVSYLQIFLGFVAGISLLIGGIGIMNIMLVSVSERTREVGIRKAVGADYSDILLQFLCESLLLTLISGIIGILISLLITLVVSATGLMGDNLQLSISGVTWGLTVSILTGVIFGIIPARKAALMKLVDALRFE